jgi:hypothetical protein
LTISVDSIDQKTGGHAAASPKYMGQARHLAARRRSA